MPVRIYGGVGDAMRCIQKMMEVETGAGMDLVYPNRRRMAELDVVHASVSCTIFDERRIPMRIGRERYALGYAEGGSVEWTPYAADMVELVMGRSGQSLTLNTDKISCM